MKLERYSIERLDEPEGSITHKLVYESSSKNKNCGGFGCGIRYRGTYKECLEKKKEIENGKEVWKSIEGYEGLYQVSNLGRIKRLTKTEYIYNYLTKSKVKRIRKEKILSGKEKTNDYVIVSLSNNGITKSYTIHRLVAQAFIPNPNNLPQVNHINGIKNDNRVENLEWCNSSDNIKHSYRTGLRKTTKKQMEQAKRNVKKAADANKKKVYQISKEGKTIKLWDSMSDIFRELHYCWSGIGLVCRGKREYAYGYKWKYKEDKNVSNADTDCS